MVKRTLKHWATNFNGRQYPIRLTETEKAELKEDGIVMVYGASDDLCEFDGAVYDEVDAPGSAYINSAGDVTSRKMKGFCREIEIHWCPNDMMSWSYETDIPHETFFILEDNEINCRAILFYLKDCRPKTIYEVCRAGTGYEVWDVEHSNNKYSLVRVDSKGAYDDIHEPLAGLIGKVLNYIHSNKMTIPEFLKEIGLD